MNQSYTDISQLVNNYKQGQPIKPSGGPERSVVYDSQNSNEGFFDNGDIDVFEAIEHEPEPDVKPFVEARQETIKIDKELEKTGVTSTGSTRFPTYKGPDLPLSDQKIMKGLHAPLTSSLRWLSEVCMLILKRAHVYLKSSHGKIVRVLRRTSG